MYISVPKSVQLIPKSFTGNPAELREFIQNVEAAFEVVEPLDYPLLYRFAYAKIGGEAKTKLLARTHVENWEQARACLEENYSVWRTLIMHIGLSQVSIIPMKPLANGEPEWIRFVVIYKA